MFKIKNIVNIGIGSMFIIAAILKLISIDEFEIYIYSFNIFSFPVTTFASRIIIAGEFILGLFLILKIYYRFTRKAILSILVLFTIFLIYTAIFRNDDNCHCFGEFVELNPIESIVKNVVVIILLLVTKTTSHQDSELREIGNREQQPTADSLCLRHKPFALALALALVFIISPPDSIYNMIYSSEKEISSIDFYESFDDIEPSAISHQPSAFILDDERQMIAIVSAGCKYCKLGLKKLSLMMKNEELDIDKVNVFIWGSPESIEDFKKETNTESYPYWHIMPNQAIDITYGRFPIFIWMKDKEIIRVGDFRALDVGFFN